MTNKNAASRRGLLKAATALPIVAVGASAPAQARPIDFLDPVSGHRAHVKLRGSLGNEWVWRLYWGEVYASLPQALPIPLFKFQGLIKAKWTDNGDGTNTELLYDTSAFLDWNTEEILETFDNPITKTKNHVIHVWDGPALTKYTSGGPLYSATAKSREPAVLPWRIVDGRAWLPDSASFERPHPLDPNEWPDASSGKTTQSMISITLSGALADLEDDTLSAPHDMRWTTLRSWLPWLHLGQRPGQLLTIGTGRKISGPEVVPKKMLEILERQQPNYISSEAPWQEPMNSWERYKKQHKAKL